MWCCPFQCNASGQACVENSNLAEPRSSGGAAAAEEEGLSQEEPREEPLLEDEDDDAFGDSGGIEMDEEDELGDDEEEMGRLKANAVAAWSVNITLIIWIVWLYQRPALKQDATDQQAIVTLLRQELDEEGNSLSYDSQLKEDLKQEAGALANIAKRIAKLKTTPEFPSPSYMQQIMGDLRQQVMTEQSLLAARDMELRKSLEQTSRDIRDVTGRKMASLQGVVDDEVLGPLTSSASGLIAGLDISFATEAISLALLFSFATKSLRSKPKTESAPEPSEPPKASLAGIASAVQGGVAAAVGTTPAKSAGREKRLRSSMVLRFYGRWDDEQEWVLVQSLVLTGVGNFVVGTVRSSRGWIGSWSDRILTALVARSARGLVRRRGWKRIMEQTMDEVGRNFHLGYLVETAADKADSRISVASEVKLVQAVPTTVVLDA